MGVISANTGLSSGINITGTISKLMAIASEPVTTLSNTDTTLTNQETAITQLQALLLSVQEDTQTLGKASVWGSQTATSSDSSVLGATVTGSPTAGTYQYTPLQLAQSQQLMSSGMQSADSALGGGTLTFRYGNTVNQGVSLSDINGGQGFAPGEIRITDRSGASAVINLSTAQNIDDVLQAINSATGINVKASTDDGQIVLTDNTGQHAADLTVQEVNGGTTAASLGLAKVDLAADSTSNSVTGSDILTLANNTPLSALNDGAGVEMNPFSLGTIDYTLHDGTTGTIDLSGLSGDSTVSDVISQISTQSKGKLQASLSSQGLVLTDTTVTTANAGNTFSVSNGDSSDTASNLGFVGSTTSSSLTGTQIAGGVSTVLLQALNDGGGVQVNSSSMGDIDYTLHDGTKGTIDLSGQTTLGGVLQQIDNQSGGKLEASISGQGLVITDTTADSGNAGNTFTIANAAGSTAASDLGIASSSTSASIGGSPIIGGLQTVLLSDLNGGQGLGTLGDLNLSDGNGNPVTVNLGGAVTLQDVIGDINTQASAAGVDITAEVNSAGNGIQLVDSSGGSDALTAANGGDGLDTATKLGLATASGPGTSTTGTLNSGDLHLRTVSTNTLVSSYNGGTGVAAGSFQIIDSAGAVSTVQITSGMQTIGDVISAINRSTTGVYASINPTGDGILLTDTAGGSGTLSVSAGDSQTAADLHLTGAETTVDGAQTINGTTTQTITLQPGDTLTDLQTDINNLGAGLSAQILNDGSSNPYRLALTATQSGQAGNMIVDTSQIAGLSLQELTQGQNALLALGGSSSSTPVIASSSTNTFTGVLSGVSLQVNGTASSPVSITVGNDGTNIGTDLQNFVTDYNKLQTQLTTDTTYNTTTETGSVLSDDGTALEIDTQLSQLVTTQFASSGAVQSLADVGITVNSDGSLSFNQDTFNSAWAANPTEVQNFFTTAKTGMSAQFDTLITQLAGQDNSLLSTRATALQTEISDNQDTINQMNQRLNDQQNLLYTEFYNMDLTIGKLKNTQSVLSTLVSLSPDFGGSNSTSSGSSSSSSSSSSS